MDFAERASGEAGDCSGVGFGDAGERGGEFVEAEAQFGSAGGGGGFEDQAEERASARVGGVSDGDEGGVDVDVCGRLFGEPLHGGQGDEFATDFDLIVGTAQGLEPCLALVVGMDVGEVRGGPPAVGEWEGVECPVARVCWIMDEGAICESGAAHGEVVFGSGFCLPPGYERKHWGRGFGWS